MKNSIIWITTIFFLIPFGCAGSRCVKDPITDNCVSVPECEDYIGKFKNIGFKINILKKLETEINISSEYKTSLEKIHQYYTLKAKDLCSKFEPYVTAGKADDWFCMDKRLGNSSTQLEIINNILKGIGNIEDAKQESKRIEQLLDVYFAQFFKQFDKDCSSAPSPSHKELVLHPASSNWGKNIPQASGKLFYYEKNKGAFAGTIEIRNLSSNHEYLLTLNDIPGKDSNKGLRQINKKGKERYDDFHRITTDGGGNVNANLSFPLDSERYEVKFLVKDTSDWKVVLHNDFLLFTVE